MDSNKCKKLVRDGIIDKVLSIETIRDQIAGYLWGTEVDIFVCICLGWSLRSLYWYAGFNSFCPPFLFEEERVMKTYLHRWGHTMQHSELPRFVETVILGRIDALAICPGVEICFDDRDVDFVCLPPWYCHHVTGVGECSTFNRFKFISVSCVRKVWREIYHTPLVIPVAKIVSDVCRVYA